MGADRLWVFVVFVLRIGFAVGVVACGTPASPEKVVEPTRGGSATVSPPPAVDAAVTAGLVDAGAVAGTGTVAAVDAAGSTRTVEIRGLGQCKRDADCVLSAYQEGCCVQACEGYATNKADLAKRQAKENCHTGAPRECPPPSPCRLPDHTITGVRCSAHHCVAVAQEPVGP